MKICAITTWPPHRDGISLYSAYLYTYISKHAKVKVLANIIDTTIPSDTKLPGLSGRCDIVRCWRRDSILYPSAIFSNALKERADINHLQHGWLLYGGKTAPLLFPILLFFLRLTGRPLITTMHTVIAGKPRLHRSRIVSFLSRTIIVFLTKLIVKISDKVIVHNLLMKKALEDLYLLKKYSQKIHVIPHGVMETVNVGGGKRGGEVKILSLGFVRKGKGVEYLLEAFKAYSFKYPNAILIIAGGRHAHDREDYISLMRRKVSGDMLKNVIFTDFVDEEKLDKLILESHIIVLLSRGEYFIEASGTLARVAMYGKPVICSRVPKFKADLEDGKDCIMVESDNPKSLAEALLLLTNNRSLREEIGRNLKMKFKNRVWGKVAEQHIHLFKAALEKKH